MNNRRYSGRRMRGAARINTGVLVAILGVMVAVLLGLVLWLVLSSGKKDKDPTPVAEVQTEAPEPTEEPEAEPTEEPIALPVTDEDDNKAEESTPEPTEEPEEVNIKIAIDPGHQKTGDNGMEPVGPGSSTKKAKVSSGASGVSTGVPEYQLNLDVALKLRDELKSRGYKVYMIRTKNNVKISNIERAQAANDSGSDIYIRLHADGIDDSSVRGASALYPTTDNPYVAHLSKKSKKLSKCILNAYCKKTGFKNRGLSKRDDLTGTNWSEIPVTLLEMGFMSNGAEDETMQDEDFQQTMAEGIADGIDAYFGR